MGLVYFVWEAAGIHFKMLMLESPLGSFHFK